MEAPTAGTADEADEVAGRVVKVVVERAEGGDWVVEEEGRVEVARGWEAAETEEGATATVEERVAAAVRAAVAVRAAAAARAAAVRAQAGREVVPALATAVAAEDPQVLVLWPRMPSQGREGRVAASRHASYEEEAVSMTMRSVSGSLVLALRWPIWRRGRGRRRRPSDGDAGPVRSAPRRLRQMRENAARRISITRCTPFFTGRKKNFS